MTRSTRKLEHLQYALATGQTESQGLEDVRFIHQALPNVGFDCTSIHTSIGELSLSSPIIINAMTGGAIDTEQINRQLATVARETGIAIAVGSQMAAIKDKNEVKSYHIMRKVYPNGKIFANIGSEASVKEALEAVEMIEANALQIHLNVIQELIMPEGDRDFRGALDRIEQIRERLKVPVIVKEVGFGLSSETVNQLKSVGIKIVDIGGKGGTNFSKVENKRRNVPMPYFNDWGIPTAISLLEARKIKGIDIIASGGILNSLHIVKALGLGANAVGMAGIVLKLLMNEGVSQTIQFIDKTQQELRYFMTSLGALEISDLQKKPMIINGDTLNWCNLRGISAENIAKRPIN